MFLPKSLSSSRILSRNPRDHSLIHPVKMSQSDSDSVTSSVKSSPNPPRRCLPLHILNQLSPSKQVLPIVSDSESDSDDQSVPLPTSYYTSPSRPEKRMHLSVPSPKMAQLSIRGPGRRFQSSIPGYGQGTKKTIRVSAGGFNHEGSTSTSTNPSSTTRSNAFRRIGMSGGIPVSDPALLSSLVDNPRPLANFEQQREDVSSDYLCTHLSSRKWGMVRSM